ISLNTGFAIERLDRAERRDDDVCLMAGQPLVWHFEMPLCIRVVSLFGLEFLRPGESPRRGVSRMWPEPWRVSPVAHVADIQQAVGVAELHFGFKMPKIDHPGAEVVAQQDDVCIFFEG